MKILFLFFLFAIIGCSTSPVQTDSQSDLKTISINSSQVFKGDPSKIPGWQNMQQDTNVYKNTGKASLEKAMVNISFKEAKVIVIWYNPDIYASENYSDCNKHQDLFDSFDGKNVLKWSELINGFNSYSYEDVAYNGDLEKTGNYVEGNISVKAGFNTVVIAFINSSDEIFHTTRNDYFYVSGFEGSTFDGDVDGWSSAAWGDSEYWGDFFGSITGDSGTRVGITQGDVDLACN